MRRRRVPTRLVHHFADGVRKVKGSGAVEGDLGDRVLPVQGFPASFVVDVLGQALQLVRMPTLSSGFTLQRLHAVRLDSRSVEVRKADDRTDHRDWEHEHQAE
jgi:hypothetical protein